MSVFAWATDDAGTALLLLQDGRKVAHIVRWASDERDVGYWSAETIEGRCIEFPVSFLEAVRGVQQHFDTDVMPPAEIVAEWADEAPMKSVPVPVSALAEQQTRQPFDGRCESCGHVWTVAYAPMPLATFAEVLMTCHCPMCGADSKQVRLA
jgi:hypothetical protein